MAKTNVTKATRTAAEAGVKALTEKLNKARVDQLKKDSEDLAAFLKSRGLDIVPVVQLKVGLDDVATFEIRGLINGIPGYILRYT